MRAPWLVVTGLIVGLVIAVPAVLALNGSPVYTGCLRTQAGTFYSFQQGPQPLRECKPGDQVVSLTGGELVAEFAALAADVVQLRADVDSLLPPPPPVPAAEAGDGTYIGMVVDSVDKTDDDFEASKAATDCTNGVGNPCRFDYDSNDVFLIESANTDLAGFEAALSTTDVVTIVYDDDVASVSVFNITTDNMAVATLKVTVPSSAVSIDSSNFTVVGSGEAGYVTAIYDDANDDGVRDIGEAKLAEGTNAGGSWALSVPLQQNAVNDFVVTQRETAATSDLGTGVGVPAITEGAPAAAKVADSVGTNGGVIGILDVGDSIAIRFNEAVDAPDNGDVVELTDEDGTRVSLTCGTNATCTLSTDVITDDTITVDVILFPVILTAGGTAGLQDPAQIIRMTGYEGTDGLPVDVAGSGGGLLIPAF